MAQQYQTDKEECTNRETGNEKLEKRSRGMEDEKLENTGRETGRYQNRGGYAYGEDMRELLEEAQQGNRASRERMIQKNMGLVWSIVHRFENRGYELEDLFQVGSIGLMKAIDKFDLSFEVKFSTYAVPMIAGEIRRFLRDDGLIKVSRSLKENGAKVRQAREKLLLRLGREPTLQQISDETGFPREEIVMALEANGEVESIDRTYQPQEGKESCLADRIPQKKDSHEALLNHMLLEQLLAELGDTERRLIELRYFKEKTQTQVAAELGVSQVQVSRLEKRILLGMRRRAK